MRGLSRSTNRNEQTAGETPKEIAFELACSVKAISTYRTRVSRKMGIATTIEPAQHAITHGLICRQTNSAPAPLHCPQNSPRSLLDLGLDHARTDRRQPSAQLLIHNLVLVRADDGPA